MASLVKAETAIVHAPQRVEHDAAERVEHAVQRHYDLVWRTLRRCGVDTVSCEDAAQEVFCIFARRLDVVPAEKERAFLCGVAARVAVGERRRTRRHDAPGVLPLEEAAAHVPSGEPSAEDLFDDVRARQMLDALLARLPDELRIVFVLHELEEMTMAEIAVALSIPPGTAASRLRRARAHFESVIREAPPLVDKKKIVGAVLMATGLTTRRARALPRVAGGIVGAAALMGAALFASSTGLPDPPQWTTYAPRERAMEAAPSLSVAPPESSANVAPPSASSTTTPTISARARAPRDARPASAVGPTASTKPAPPRSELALVRAAKKALLDDHVSDALAALAERDREFPDGAFDEEADALRVEAFAQRGDLAMARRAASNFHALHPNSAYAVRVRRALEAVSAR